MAKSRKSKPKQESPVAFRPGPELQHLVTAFASSRGIGMSDAYKRLAALAAAGLDGDFHDLLAQAGARLAGPNAFVRAVAHVHTALAAAVRADPRYAREPERMRFVIATVLDQLPGAAAGVNEIVKPLLVRLGAGGDEASSEAQTEEAASPLAPEREKLRVACEE